MQEYDIALKLLLQGSAKLTVRELTGGPVEKWLDIELPKVQNTRMDLLGETAAGNSSTWNCRAATNRLCRCAWPRTASQCFGSSGDFPGKYCSTWAKHRYAWIANSAARTCLSGTA